MATQTSLTHTWTELETVIRYRIPQEIFFPHFRGFVTFCRYEPYIFGSKNSDMTYAFCACTLFSRRFASGAFCVFIMIVCHIRRIALDTLKFLTHHLHGHLHVLMHMVFSVRNLSESDFCFFIRFFLTVSNNVLIHRSTVRRLSLSNVRFRTYSRHWTRTKKRSKNVYGKIENRPRAFVDTFPCICICVYLLVVLFSYRCLSC